MHAHNFPNCFIMGPQQSGFTVNFPHMLDEQACHIAYIVRYALDNDVRTVEATEEAEDQWVETVISRAVFGRDFLESCTPGYYNNEGQVSKLAVQNGFFSGGSVEFFATLDAWRNTGTLEGMEVVSSRRD